MEDRDKSKEQLIEKLTEMQRRVTELEALEAEYKKSLAQLSKKNRYETIIGAVTRSVHQSLNLQDVLENAVESISKNIETVEYIGA